MNPIKTASVLAFERKLCNSDGLMYAGSWKDRNQRYGRSHLGCKPGSACPRRHCWPSGEKVSQRLARFGFTRNQSLPRAVTS